MNEYPNVLEQEKALLSAMIQYGDNVIPTVASIVTAEDFYRPDHRAIFDATVAVYEQKQEPNILLVEEELAKRGVLARIDRKYLFSLLDCEYTSTRAEQYAQTIKEMSIRRRIISSCKILANGAGDTSTALADLVAKAEQISTTLTTNSNSRALKLAKEDLPQIFNEVLEHRKNAGVLSGISTGSYDLNKAMGGLKKSDMIILAARPSMGKTALALNIAAAAANKNVVAMFSLEMSRNQLLYRLLSATSEVAADKIQNGYISDDDLSKIANALETLEDRQLYIDDTGGLNISEIRMRSRRLKQDQGLDLIVIDYLQLIQGSKAYAGNRVQEVSEISRELKALAKDLDVPILALSQLSRSVEMRAEKKPQLSDLRESGSIEQDADIVMFLYRDEYYNHDTEKQNLAEVIIAKNRNGATGTVQLYFEKQFMKFRDYTRREN